MKHVRLGIIGLGMGAMHARYLLEGKVRGATLSAVCDALPEKTARYTKYPQVQCFSDANALIASDAVDAVLIATPHYAHTTLGIAALKRGLNVLVEKPISVHKADCEKLLAAHTNPKQIFGAMFNQRTDPFYRKIRAMVQKGELGEIQRINWIITNWFRPESYYRASPWRATWAGEGGGVLMNQSTHNVDLFQWMFGMPSRVRAFAGFGKYHDIEVEDEVTAYFDYANGATAVFVTSTGEAPGTNRLEVTGDRGRLVFEHDVLTFTRNVVSASVFSRKSKEMYSAPATTTKTFAITGHGGQHQEVTQNFVNAIRKGTPLIAPAADGIHAVELANAMLLSAGTGKSVDLPMNAAAYARHLKQLIARSRFVKPEATTPAIQNIETSLSRSN